MGNRRDREWEAPKASYSPSQVEAVLGECGVEVVGETESDFLCYCPFHGNRHTPSFGVSRTHGSYICFNGSCGVSGTLVDLVKEITDRNEFQARRVILLAANEQELSASARVKAALHRPPEWVEFPQSTLDRLYEDFWKHQEPQQYMTGRGFAEETLRHFKVGYSAKKNLIAVPMHNPDGLPVGLIGRTIHDKRFQNSKKLPTKQTLWNLHRAKRVGSGTVIVTEASFDAMHVHQAGHPNVVASLGGYLSPERIEQFNRYFDTIIIMTDFDYKKTFHENCRVCRKAGRKLCLGHNPGRDLGMKIAQECRNKKILWASYEPKMVYPHMAKDASDMTDDEIRQCIRNAVRPHVYNSWGLY